MPTSILHVVDIFLKPHGRWWPKPYHAGPRLLLPITVICFLIWILVIVSCIASAVYEKNYDSSGRNYPPIEWTKMYDCDRSVVGTMFFPIALETIHLPIHIYLYASNKLHPATALVLSIILAANWVVLTFFASLSNYCAESLFPDAWEGLFWTRQAMGSLLALLYLAYVGYASAALHNWRRSRRRRRRDFVALREEESQMGKMGARKDADDVAAPIP